MFARLYGFVPSFLRPFYRLPCGNSNTTSHTTPLSDEPKTRLRSYDHSILQWEIRLQAVIDNARCAPRPLSMDRKITRAWAGDPFMGDAYCLTCGKLASQKDASRATWLPRSATYCVHVRRGELQSRKLRSA